MRVSCVVNGWMVPKIWEHLIFSEFSGPDEKVHSTYLTPVQWDVMVLITEKYCIKAEKCGPEGANFYAKSIKRLTDKSIQYLQLE